MKNADLSILIPARNEMFLSNTVEDILQKVRGNTEIIIVLDGAWANPPIPDDERVTVIYHSQSIGQRAATNEACRISKAKYVMKLDAHCVLDEGFDVKMMSAMKDHYTMVPILYNLHAFDWVCEEGHRSYQGPTPPDCTVCHKPVKRDIIFKPRFNRKSTFYRFDKTLHFKYWGDFENRPEAKGNIAPTMSIQGSCFMLTREKYWELNICDEKHGSWGQQGVEVAYKTWVSGGEVMVNKNTWYSHMFRTQGGDFGFPYPLSGADVEKAREYSRWMVQEGNFDKALPGRDLDWLLKKFYPVPDWHDVPGTTTKLSKKPSKEVVYYTHNVGNPLILEACRNQLARGMKQKHIIAVSNEPIKFGVNVVVDRIPEPKFYDMFNKILVGLKKSTADIVFFAEHDVLYHPSHFDFIPEKKDVYYYNTNVWRVRYDDGHALFCDDLQQLSGLVAWRETLIKHFEERIKRSKDGYTTAMGFEPGTHGRPERIDDLKASNYQSEFPNIDIRHDTNSTASRWSKEQFRNQRYTKGWKESTIWKLPGWSLPLGEGFTSITSI